MSLIKVSLINHTGCSSHLEGRDCEMATLNLFETRPPDTVLSQVRGAAGEYLHCYQAVTPIIDPTAPPNPISSSSSSVNLPSPHYKHTIPCQPCHPARFRVRERERERESSVGVVSRHACLPLTDGRADGRTDRRRAF